MGVIVPGDFKVVHIKRDFALNVFILTRFHCMCIYEVIRKAKANNSTTSRTTLFSKESCTARDMRANLDIAESLGESLLQVKL